MKRILSALLSLCASATFAATLTPIQLLNPIGSTSGQAIISTGSTTAPAWGNPIAAYAAQAANTVLANVTASSASPTAVALPSCSTSSSSLLYTSGTGFTCNVSINAATLGGVAASAYAQLGGSTFTGSVGLSYSNPMLSLNDSTGGAKATILFQKSGVTAWDLSNASNASNVFGLDRFVSGSYVDTPISVSNSTGAVTMSDGITSSPISGSTGSFTTLAASSTVSGTGFSNYLASPPTIGGTTPGTVNASGGTLNSVSIGLTSPGSAQFSQLVMTGLLTPLSTSGIKGTTTNDSPAAGSVGENPTNSTTSTSMTNNTPANCTSQSLTAGNWLVWGVTTFVPGATTTVSQVVSGISTTSATLGSSGSFSSIAATLTTGANQALVTPPQTLKLASTTTVYLIGQSQFATSTMTCSGNIYAIRIR